MRQNKILNVIFVSSLFSGCAIVDNSLAPIDTTINNTKVIYNDTSNYIDNSLYQITNKVSDTKSILYENKLINFFIPNEIILDNRELNFIKWNTHSKHNVNKIIRRYLKNKKINLKEKQLLLSDKMEILKEYFFNKLKTEYLNEFLKNHKKVTFDSFLTDRENIEKIYQYKLALSEWEHKWNVNIFNTQKKVSELILSTLFGKQSVKFISYNPYDKELFLSIRSQRENFNQKIKISVDKNIAKDLKKNINHTKSSVFFQLIDDKLELVGVNIYYKKDVYLGEFTDYAYFRQKNISISTDTLDLKEQDVQYTKLIQNITPPSWFYTLKDERIGYGQGKNEKDAKIDAFKNIAQSIKVVVNSNFIAKKKLEGSILTKSLKSDINIKSDAITIKNSKVLKVEKKDSIWFIAIKY